jgi:enoyl-CoA hydratase/carnithine racemase
MSNAAEISIDDRIPRLRLLRPDAHSAIDSDIMSGLLVFAGEMLEPGEVRVIALSGKGKRFCAGPELRSLAEMIGGNLSAGCDDVTEALRDSSAGGANRARQPGSPTFRG